MFKLYTLREIKNSFTFEFNQCSVSGGLQNTIVWLLGCHKKKQQYPNHQIKSVPTNKIPLQKRHRIYKKTEWLVLWQ